MRASTSICPHHWVQAPQRVHPRRRANRLAEGPRRARSAPTARGLEGYDLLATYRSLHHFDLTIDDSCEQKRVLRDALVVARREVIDARRALEAVHRFQRVTQL